MLSYVPLLRGSSKAPLGVYYAYFPDWQGLPDIVIWRDVNAYAFDLCLDQKLCYVVTCIFQLA